MTLLAGWCMAAPGAEIPHAPHCRSLTCTCWCHKQATPPTPDPDPATEPDGGDA
jgi:hypothetical protein